MYLAYQDGKRILVRDSFMFFTGCGGWFSYGRHFKILRKAKSDKEAYEWLSMRRW